MTGISEKRVNNLLLAKHDYLHCGPKYLGTTLHKRFFLLFKSSKSGIHSLSPGGIKDPVWIRYWIQIALHLLSGLKFETCTFDGAALKVSSLKLCVRIQSARELGKTFYLFVDGNILLAVGKYLFIVCFAMPSLPVPRPRLQTISIFFLATFC